MSRAQASARMPPSRPATQPPRCLCPGHFTPTSSWPVSSHCAGTLCQRRASAGLCTSSPTVTSPGVDGVNLCCCSYPLSSACSCPPCPRLHVDLLTTLWRASVDCVTCQVWGYGSAVSSVWQVQVNPLEFRTPSSPSMSALRLPPTELRRSQGLLGLGGAPGAGVSWEALLLSMKRSPGQEAT